MRELVRPFVDCSSQNNILEQALETWGLLSQQDLKRAGELTLRSVDGGIEWHSQRSSGELALVVCLGESPCTEELIYHPSPDPEL